MNLYLQQNTGVFEITIFFLGKGSPQYPSTNPKTTLPRGYNPKVFLQPIQIIGNMFIL